MTTGRAPSLSPNNPVVVVITTSALHQPRAGAAGRRRRDPRRPRRRDRRRSGDQPGRWPTDPAADLPSHRHLAPSPATPDDAGISVGAVGAAPERRPPICSGCASGCRPWPPPTARPCVRAPTLVHAAASEVTHNRARPAGPVAAIVHRPRPPTHPVESSPPTLPPELRVNRDERGRPRSIHGHPPSSRCRSRASQLHPRDRSSPPRARTLHANFPAPGRRGRGVAPRRCRRLARDVEHGRAGRLMSDLVRAALNTVSSTAAHRSRSDKRTARWAHVMRRRGRLTPAQLALARLMRLPMRRETVDQLRRLRAGDARFRSSGSRAPRRRDPTYVRTAARLASGTSQHLDHRARWLAAAAGVPVAKHGRRGHGIAVPASPGRARRARQLPDRPTTRRLSRARTPRPQALPSCLSRETSTRRCAMRVHRLDAQIRRPAHRVRPAQATLAQPAQARGDSCFGVGECSTIPAPMAEVVQRLPGTRPDLGSSSTGTPS